MTYNELKPCPFCGRIVEHKVVSVCECGAIVHYLWNSRPIEDALRAEVEQLRVQLAKSESEAAELREKLRWIPVEERLPEKDGWYLVRLNWGGGSKSTDVRWYLLKTGWGTSLGVTHWRPLPAPPEVYTPPETTYESNYDSNFDDPDEWADLPEAQP